MNINYSLVNLRLCRRTLEVSRLQVEALKKKKQLVNEKLNKKGKKVMSWKMPTSSTFYNTALGIAYFLEDGDLIFAGFFNTKRINFKK